MWNIRIGKDVISIYSYYCLTSVYTTIRSHSITWTDEKCWQWHICISIDLQNIHMYTTDNHTNIVTIYTWTIEKVNVWLLAGVLFAIESLFALNRSLRQYKTSSDRQLASHLYWRQWGLVHKGSGHMWLMSPSVVFVIETDTETKMLLVSLISAILFNYRMINTKAEVKCSHCIM